MLRGVMSTEKLDTLNETSQQMIPKCLSPNDLNNKLKNNISLINTIKNSKKLHKNCEILADQNSNSNSSNNESEGSNADSTGDQRTMDAADTLLSIANTPTTEFKAFAAASSSSTALPTTSNERFEISVNNNCSVNTISLDELTNEKESNIEDEKVKSAIKLILQKASKKFPNGKLPTSITIKTGTTSVPSSDKQNDEESSSIEESSSKDVNTPSQLELKQNSTQLDIEKCISNKTMNQITAVQTPNFSVHTANTTATSSSLLFLSTGQVKKQKKFRETTELKQIIPQDYGSKIISTQEENLVKKQISPIKLEPEIVCDVQLQNANEEVHHEEIINMSRINTHSDAKMNVMYNKTSEKLPYINSSDSDTSEDITNYLKGQKKRVNSNCSSSSNINDNNISINSIRSAPTLATGRRSKDTELPPDESKKRQERRERNKEAAAKCRKKREDQAQRLELETKELKDIRLNLKRKFDELLAERNRLEKIFQYHEKVCPYAANTNEERINKNSSETSSPVQSQQQLVRIKKEHYAEKNKQESKTGQNSTSYNKNSSNYFPSTSNKEHLEGVRGANSQQYNQISNFSSNDILNQIMIPKGVDNCFNLQAKHQIQRPGNLKLKTNQTSGHYNKNEEIAKKSAALYQILSINSTPINYRHGNILLTPTFPLNTPILAFTPSYDYGHTLNTPNIQQYFVNNSIEKTNDPNDGQNNASSDKYT